MYYDSCHSEWTSRWITAALLMHPFIYFFFLMKWSRYLIIWAHAPFHQILRFKFCSRTKKPGMHFKALILFLTQNCRFVISKKLQMKSWFNQTLDILELLLSSVTSYDLFGQRRKTWPHVSCVKPLRSRRCFDKLSVNRRPRPVCQGHSSRWCLAAGPVKP